MERRLVMQVVCLVRVRVVTLPTDYLANVREAPSSHNDDIYSLNVTDTPQVAHNRPAGLTNQQLLNIVVVGADEPVVVRRHSMSATGPMLLRIALKVSEGSEGVG